MHYVIIGNSAAAIGAVEAIRKQDAENPITMIADEPYHTYSRPLISYYLSGKVTQEQMYYRDPDFYERNNVRTLFGVKAEQIDTQRQQVVLADGNSVAYDKLLIATGGKPFVPPLDGADKQGVYRFIKLDHAKELDKVAVAGKKAVIIGAGLIGLKAAEGLSKRGVQLTVVELANRVLSAILDEQAAAFVQQELERHHITFELNTTVERITGGEQANGVVLKNGKQLDCDFVVIAIGVTPNTDIVKQTNIRTNRGILVNEQLETSVPNVYAAGDVCEGYDMLFNEQRVLPILPNAYMQGETAGFNMAGCPTAFNGGFAMNSIGFFGFPMITAGIIRPQGEEFDQRVRSNSENNTYKKVVLRGRQLVGFIALNEVDRAGILTGLIRDQIDVSGFADQLLKPNFGYADLPQELRNQRLQKGRRTS